MFTDRSSAGRRHARIGAALCLALLFSAAACGQAGRGGKVATDEDVALLGPALAASCNLEQMRAAPPGLSSLRTSNGLTGNGLCQNGLVAAGLDLARMNTADFATWFDDDPALAAMILKYLYRCAAPEGQSIAWTNPSTGIDYTWAGGLGLAPGWVSGAAATPAEQEVVSACLAALTNKYGVSVEITVEGRSATGEQIPIGEGELTTFAVREGCFFGNLFAGQGLFVGFDGSPWEPDTSSPRACALDTRTGGSSMECPPIAQVGFCSDLCVLDATGTFYEECTLNGATFRPLTTRIRPSDVYRCGDGVCQFTESCGDGAAYDNCASDCGACP